MHMGTTTHPHPVLPQLTAHTSKRPAGHPPQGSAPVPAYLLIRQQAVAQTAARTNDIARVHSSSNPATDQPEWTLPAWLYVWQAPAAYARQHPVWCLQYSRHYSSCKSQSQVAAPCSGIHSSSPLRYDSAGLRIVEHLLVPSSPMHPASCV